MRTTGFPFTPATNCTGMGSVMFNNVSIHSNVSNELKNPPPPKSCCFRIIQFLNLLSFFLILASFGVFWVVFFDSGNSGGGSGPRNPPLKGEVLNKFKTFIFLD